MSKKVIITCAVTGSVHTPTMSPYLPVTPAEIAEQAIAAAEAGASILHLHARDPKDGRPTADPAVFMAFLPVIKQATDAAERFAEHLDQVGQGEPGGLDDGDGFFGHPSTIAPSPRPARGRRDELSSHESLRSRLYTPVDMNAVP